jgi:hypothetical protein
MKTAYIAAMSPPLPTNTDIEVRSSIKRLTNNIYQALASGPAGLKIKFNIVIFDPKADVIIKTVNDL